MTPARLAATVFTTLTLVRKKGAKRRRERRKENIMIQQVVRCQAIDH